MAQNTGSGNGEGLSLQTLLIAAAASAAAAIVTSHLWKDGTVIAAAMTPVIVAIVKELLAKPMDSEIVRKPVEQVSKIAAGRRAVAGEAAARTEAVRAGALPAPPSIAGGNGPPVVDGGGAEVTPGDVVLSHPRRTYGVVRRRRLHLKVAIVTGLLAFVLGALVLTLPELLFGGPVTSSGGSTTLFGGKRDGASSSSSEKKKDASKEGGSDSAPGATEPDGGARTTPAAPPSDSEDPDEPTSTTPAPTTPAPAPTTPAPVPSQPPAGSDGGGGGAEPPSP